MINGMSSEFNHQNFMIRYSLAAAILSIFLQSHALTSEHNYLGPHLCLVVLCVLYCLLNQGFISLQHDSLALIAIQPRRRFRDFHLVN